MPTTLSIALFFIICKTGSAVTTMEITLMVQDTAFRVSKELLRSSSPVFAKQLEWKDEAILVINEEYKPADFGVFIDCLQHEQNTTARRGDVLVFAPDVIRRVLPIANFYQAEGLKQVIFDTAIGLAENKNKILVDATWNLISEEACLSLAADMIESIEASLPPEPFEWPQKIYKVLMRRMVTVYDESPGIYQSDASLTVEKSKVVVKTRVVYKKQYPVASLSLGTLQRCLESLDISTRTELVTEVDYSRSGNVKSSNLQPTLIQAGKNL
jgi:hypothetical protein